MFRKTANSFVSSKVSAEMLVKSGYYSSFSDVVRTGIRGILKN